MKAEGGPGEVPQSCCVLVKAEAQNNLETKEVMSVA